MAKIAGGKGPHPNIFFNKNNFSDEMEDQKTVDNKTNKDRFQLVANNGQQPVNIRNQNPRISDLNRRQSNIKHSKFNSNFNSPRNSILSNKPSFLNRGNKGASWMKEFTSHEQNIFHSQSVINESINPIHIESHLNMSEIEHPYMAQNHQIIGVYLNQHLEFVHNENDGYLGDESVFMFRFDGNNLRVYRAKPNHFKYFKVSTEGIFIGNLYTRAITLGPGEVYNNRLCIYIHS